MSNFWTFWKSNTNWPLVIQICDLGTRWTCHIISLPRSLSPLKLVSPSTTQRGLCGQITRFSFHSIFWNSFHEQMQYRPSFYDYSQTSQSPSDSASTFSTPQNFTSYSGVPNLNYYSQNHSEMWLQSIPSQSSGNLAQSSSSSVSIQYFSISNFNDHNSSHHKFLSIALHVLSLAIPMDPNIQ